MAEINDFPLWNGHFIGKNGHFRHIFYIFEKLIKYTCFPKIRKIAILRGPKLSRCWSDWNEILTAKNIRRDLFNRENRSQKDRTAAEGWAPQNRDFWDFRKNHVFFWSKIFFKKGILTMTETIKMVKKMVSRPLNVISFFLAEKWLNFKKNR